MARYFMELSYNGTRFHGWQGQLNATSVQHTLEGALSTLLRQPTELVGAGRTDTGVHARFYVAHLDADPDSGIEHPDFVYHLNALIGYDIAVHRIYRVSDQAHARFSAVEREYTYYIVTKKDPFRRETAYCYTQPLDLSAMNQAAQQLLQHEDFTSFAKLHTDTKTNICNVTKAEFVREGSMLIFTIRADRFLRNMVRAIVGTLLEVGRGNCRVEEFAGIIERKDRSAASGSASPSGLFLSDVIYPEWVYHVKP